jgi:hypothetical protein
LGLGFAARLKIRPCRCEFLLPPAVAGTRDHVSLFHIFPKLPSFETGDGPIGEMPPLSPKPVFQRLYIVIQSFGHRLLPRHVRNIFCDSALKQKSPG